MDKISLETSQHVLINYEPADIFQRLLAFLVDGIILLAYTFVVNFIWDGVTPQDFAWKSEYGWVMFLLVTIPVFLYYLVIETLWNGYTVGKRIVGIRVVKVDGSRPGLGDYLVRWFFRLFEVTLMAGSVAIITILLNGKGQRLGDIVAKTAVVKDKSKTKLSDTIFAEIEDDTEANFSSEIDLSDKDVGIIKEVLNARKTYDYNTWFVMVTKTRKAIEEKTGVVKPEMKSHEYLSAIIEDYNRLYDDKV